MPIKARSGDGFYKLAPPLKGSADSPILIEGLDGGLADIVYPVSTLDEKQYLFVLGEDFGNVVVNGLALLGKAELGGRAFGEVVAYFKTNRVSKGKKPIQVSMPGSTSLTFYLTGLQVGKPDPQYHLQFFSFRGVSVEPKGA